MGVSKGSFHGALLLNIDIYNLFFIMEDCDIVNYANKNTPYSCGKDKIGILSSLENVSPYSNGLKLYHKLIRNTCKHHLLISSGEDVHINISASKIQNSSCEKLL